MWSEDGEHHMSDTYRWYMGGLMACARDGVDVRAVRELVQALPARFVGADRDRGAATTGPAGSARWASTRARVECRIPGADANRTSRSRRRSPRGCGGIENEVEPPPMFVGNAYEAKDVPRVPYSLHEAVETFRGSTVAESVRRLRVRAPAEHGPPGAGHLRQHDRHRLGARPLLRARVGSAGGRRPAPRSRCRRRPASDGTPSGRGARDLARGRACSG